MSYMKRMSIFAVVMLLCVAAEAQKLDARQMENNARRWAAAVAGSKSVQVSRVQLDGVESVGVFNITGGGFVIVSGDSRARTVLGYSRTGSFDSSSMPDNVRYWLGEYQRQIDSLDLLRPEDFAVTDRPALAKDGMPDSVAPLLVTEWNQYRYGYNSLVPEDSTYAGDSTMARFEGHPTVGCSALAMAQIMRYWQYPQHGYGQHSYTYEGSDSCWRYGTVGADFGAATYDYSLMPWKLSDSSSAAEVEAVATLLFHCGVAGDMKYNSDCQGSSGASIQNCLSGMKHYFHYNRESYQAYRRNYSDAMWDNMIMADLAAGRPVYYAGQSYQDDNRGTLAGGHAFVLDGYDTNGLFHVNWGWDGRCNGYYSTSAMQPMTQYDFTPLQYAVFNLEPGYSHLVMGSDLTMDAPSFQVGDSICGHYSITNVGDSVGSMFVGVNIYPLNYGDYCGCVDGRRVTVAPGDTVVCRFAWPLHLARGRYTALMQYSTDSFYAGVEEDRTFYMDDLEHVFRVDFEVVDTTYRNLTNLVVFVRFRDDAEIGTNFMTIQNMLNGGVGTVSNFFKAISFNHINFNTEFASQHQGGQIISYVDPMPRDYFRPYSDSNPIGYTTPNPQVGISMREAQLIARIARYVDSARLVKNTINLDGNDDGNIDNLSIIVKGDVDGWGELLWPHMEFFPHDSVGYTVTINGKRVNAFNMEFEGSGSTFNYKTFCHEMCHSLGLPDLYHYNHYKGVTPVPYDLMGSSRMCQPSYIYRHKILHLGMTPTQIKQNGTYSIYYSTTFYDVYVVPQLYYIKSAHDTNQWYTIEYRVKGSMYETDLPASGLVIGRWMDTVRMDIQHCGNAFFNYPSVPNTYWVFRPGSDSDTVNGFPESSVFNPEEGRTEFGPNTDPHPYTADGTPERSFRIYNIVMSGDVCNFSVEFLEEGVDDPATSETVMENFRLYPNPANSSVTVELPQGFPAGEDCHVAVLDAVGHEVMRRQATGGRCQLDVGSLSAGVYFVTLTSHQGVATQKLIIQ